MPPPLPAKAAAAGRPLAAEAVAHEETHGSFGGYIGVRIFMVVVPLVILLLLAVGLGYVRLRHGPVTLKVLAGPIERGIAAELPGITARIDDVIVSLGDDGRLKFQLQNLRLREADGDPVASAPQAAVELSGAALKSFRIVPSRVELIEPTVSLTLGDDGRLALSFTHVPEDGSLGQGQTHGNAPPPSELSRVPGYGGPPSPGGAGALHRIDVARALADATARARQRIDAASYLREIGVRNATVLFDQGGRRSQWRVLEMSVDMEHRSERSIISGAATVASSKGPWSLTFLSEDSEGADGARLLKVKSSIRGLTPATLARALPALSAAAVLDAPVSGDVTLALSPDGEIRSGELQVEVGRGQVHMSGEIDAPVGIDGGLLKFVYDGAARRVTLQPSTLVAGQSRATLTGEIAAPQGAGTNERIWPFKVRARDGIVAAEDVGVGAVPLDAFEVDGRVFPNTGITRFDAVRLKAAGAEITLAGEVGLAGGVLTKPNVRFDGKISPMTADAAKRLWPRSIAAPARKWFGQRVVQAGIRGGTLHIASTDTSQPAPATGPPAPRLTLAIEAGDVVLSPAPGMPNVEVPRVLVRLENETFDVAMPDATILLAANHRLPLKGVRFSVPDLGPDNPIGELALRVQAPLAQVAEFCEHPGLQSFKLSGIKLDGIDGKVDGQIKVAWPLASNVQVSDVKIEGKVRVSEGRASKLAGIYDVQGGTVTLDITEKAADAKGDMLVNGVPMKATWQRLFDGAPDRQPPLRIVANLDNADRNQLGLDINDIVQGEVPIEITVTRESGGDPGVRLRADLTKAEMTLDAVAWRKPPGRTAIMQADIVKGRTHKIELQGFKVAGDDIAIEGTASIGADNRMSEFNFPDFSLNVVSRLDVRGTLRPDNIWEVKAKGTAYDGRDLFRNVFLFGQQAKTVKAQRPAAGFDFEGDIDTVIGFQEVSLRSLKMRLTKRGDKLVTLDARGTLDGGNQLALALRPASNGEPRKLLADSTDAGQVFKLIGFYPNMQGGRVRLEVNLDGRGPAEKTGILWVDQFRILGDPVVAEVLNSADSTRPAIEGRRIAAAQVRETFDFERMRAPFSIGHGQFALEDSYVRGPLLGATLRGKVDYNARTVNLGGTYVPLQGLNNALGDIPLLGQILSGPRGEGIFGITYAIQGSMAQPQVIVNPLSVVAPGIFREIFQLSDPDTRVRAVDENRPKSPPEARVRSSAPPATPPAVEPSAAKLSAGRGGAPKPDVIDGWSSSTQSAPGRK